MDVSEKYPELGDLVIYFHQDWKECYLWDEEPDYPPIVRFYKVHNPQSSLGKAIMELKELLSKGYNEPHLKDIIYGEFSMNLHLPHWNLTYKEWLEDVLRILEEPMEKTKKQYIPYKA
jgi:hypothetical protein